LDDAARAGDGHLVLCFAAVPLLAPLGHIISLLLSVWLHGMLAIVNWCAALPQAYIDLPVRYTLLVFGMLGVLAWLFWRAKRLLWYLPAAVLCSVVAVVLGIAAQRDVVRIALVGAGNNPCLVCTQNDSAVILFRGGKSNLNAVEEYLAEQALLPLPCWWTCGRNHRNWIFPGPR
jgi:competence protein ComEC